MSEVDQQATPMPSEPVIDQNNLNAQENNDNAASENNQAAGFGSRGRGERGRGRGGRRAPKQEEEKEWIPVTKLGRLVKANKITSIEQIYLFSLPIKEAQIVDKLVPDLKDEVVKIMSVQKQTTAGQRTRFKAFVIVGDSNGHFGLGIKCSKEVATAIRGGITVAKLNLIPIRRGYWGENLGQPHTIPLKVSGKCGSVTANLIPAPRGTGIVAAPVVKKVLQLSGITDCYTNSRGSTRTMGNFVKAVYASLKQTYSILTPNLWTDYEIQTIPYQEHTDFLAKQEEKKL